MRPENDIRKKWKDLKAAALKHPKELSKTGGSGRVKEPLYKEIVDFILGEQSELADGIVYF